MKKLLGCVLVLGLVGPVLAAESYQDLSREFNQVYAEQLRNKVLKLPKNATVEIALKNGKIVQGTFEGFQKYDDGVWILPLGKRGLFADEAYDIRELQDIKLVVVRPI